MLLDDAAAAPRLGEDEAARVIGDGLVFGECHEEELEGMLEHDSAPKAENEAVRYHCRIEGEHRLLGECSKAAQAPREELRLIGEGGGEARHADPPRERAGGREVRAQPAIHEDEAMGAAGRPGQEPG